jgi:drug/metabolite transporter (DMT)-like permease
MGQDPLYAIAVGLGALGVAVGGVIAALDSLPGFEDVYFGAGTGVLLAKLVFVYAERRRGEMPDLLRRRLEARWLVAGGIFGAALFALVEVL